MTTRVLLIGHGLFGEGLHRLLAASPHLAVVAAVDDWEAAQAWLAQHEADVLIVDRQTVSPDILPLPPSIGHGHAPRVIYLTLAENKMTIYTPQIITDAHKDDLLAVLEATGPSGKKRP
jgi:DNA-binding NarL/FixJ family response regulator